MAIGIKVKRNNKIANYSDKVRQNLSTVIRNSCAIIERSAKQKCPVDTGNLRGSIVSKMTSDIEGEVGTNCEYAFFVEFGTAKHSAQPFLIPALEENRDKIKSEIAKALKG